MAGTKNFASKYAKKVDERFTQESQALMVVNSEYDFSGVDTVNVYSIPIVAMGDYQRTGTNRYGTPNDLGRNVQSMKITRDRAFTFIIDKGDKNQTQMVLDAGKALSRQTSEGAIPEFDAYVFRTLAAAATANGSFSSTPITKNNAYEMFLAAQEYLGNHHVPNRGRVALCSYRFANYLKQDPAFMKYGNLSQEMVDKGLLGEVDGCKIVKVTSDKLPNGCAFMITHPVAATAPKQLEDYKIHDNPPGISGWLVEGRIVYDCFVLRNKADAIYYHGSQGVLKLLNIVASPDPNEDKTVVVISNEAEGTNTFKYQTYTGAAPAVTYNQVLTDGWTAITSGSKITVADGDHIIVAEVTSDNKAQGVGMTHIN